MKRKIIMLLASCSLAVAIIVPVATAKSVVNVSTLMLIQVMGHGTGGG